VSATRTWISALISYAVLLYAFWYTAHRFAIHLRIGGNFASAFASFALLLGAFWAFGFGFTEILERVLQSRASRVTVGALFVTPYVLFAAPRGELHIVYFGAFAGIGAGLSALYEFLPPGGLHGAGAGLSWQDVIALAALGLPVEFGWLRGAWPQPGLGSMPKLLLVDIGLYVFLFVRRMPGVGYDFRPRLRDVAVGLREWAFFAPIAIVLGFALHFIKFQQYLPVPGTAALAWLVTFLFVAIPEELYFRGLLQNLLEKRIGPNRALFASAAIFGLSHFNKITSTFNWRYVILATIAGIFYGRAWRDRRRLFSSGITHATIDTVWSLWFR
jgi:hypothetical protein